MKHQAILAGRKPFSREERVPADYEVRVRCETGDIDAHVINVTSDGFRLRSLDPLEVGWEVTLEVGEQNPVKAVICWACGLDAGGVFAEPVAL